MNVSSVNFSQMLQMSSVHSNGSTLTALQQALIEETLAEYDVDNFSQSDAEAIVAVFEKAGITPSAALESAMSDAGFDAKEVGTLAGVGPQGGGGKGPAGPPPTPTDEELSTIEELLESLLTTDEEEDEESVTASTSFESILDYTFKIVNLKEDAKTEVMDILEKYGSDANEFTQADTQAYIINSLRQILNEPDNFNSFSLYV